MKILKFGDSINESQDQIKHLKSLIEDYFLELKDDKFKIAISYDGYYHPEYGYSEKSYKKGFFPKFEIDITSTSSTKKFNYEILNKIETISKRMKEEFEFIYDSSDVTYSKKIGNRISLKMDSRLVVFAKSFDYRPNGEISNIKKLVKKLGFQVSKENRDLSLYSEYNFNFGLGSEFFGKNSGIKDSMKSKQFSEMLENKAVIDIVNKLSKEILKYNKDISESTIFENLKNGSFHYRNNGRDIRLILNKIYRKDDRVLLHFLYETFSDNNEHEVGNEEENDLYV